MFASTYEFGLLIKLNELSGSFEPENHGGVLYREAIITSIRGLSWYGKPEERSQDFWDLLGETKLRSVG